MDAPDPSGDGPPTARLRSLLHLRATERDGEEVRFHGDPLVPRSVLTSELSTVFRDAGYEARVVDGRDVGEVTVVAEYTAAGRAETTETTLSYSPAPTTDVTVTGIDVSRNGGVVTISGDAANVGSADASSVVMRVVPADGVTPVGPNKEYFVGAVESSQFSTFQLTANVSSGASEVPVRIEYTVDGERLSRVVEVDVSDAAGSGDGQSDTSAPGFSLLLGGVAVVIAVALAGAYRRFTG